MTKIVRQNELEPASLLIAGSFARGLALALSATSTASGRSPEPLR
jgi:hypothetical protein